MLVERKEGVGEGEKSKVSYMKWLKYSFCAFQTPLPLVSVFLVKNSTARKPPARHQDAVVQREMCCAE